MSQFLPAADNLSERVAEATFPFVQAWAVWMLAKADSCFAFIIAINGVVLVVETDHRPDTDAGMGWFLVDSLFNSLFLFEVVLRVIVFRRLWVYSPWNIFDAVLVATSVVDVWVLPLLAVTSPNMRMLTTLRIMRLFRMLRILRLVRLLKHARQLVLLTQALWGALRTMIWFVILMFWVLFIMGLLTTRLVGQRDDSSVQAETVPDEEDMGKLFRTLPRSVLTLFMFTTLEAWPDVTRAKLKDAPWQTLFFVVFIVFTNVTLLNTVAGVLVENVLSVSRHDEEQQQALVERKLDEETWQVGLELANADRNANGMLDIDELRSAAAQEDSKLSKFLQLADQSLEEAEAIFHLVDDRGKGAVQLEEFVSYVRRARGRVQSKHILAVSRDLHILDRLLDESKARVAGLSEHLGRLELLAGGEAGDGTDASALSGAGLASRVIAGINSGCAAAVAAGDGDSAAGGVGPIGPKQCEDDDKSDKEAAMQAAVEALRREFQDQLRVLESRLSGPRRPTDIIATDPEPEIVPGPP